MRVINGMYGLGDNIYQRAILKNLKNIGLYTPWPELYADLEIECYKPTTSLRTQLKNIKRSQFKTPPSNKTVINMRYDDKGTILESLERSINLKFEKIDFSGPPTKKVIEKPYIVVRPITRRKEWECAARNPNPEYLHQAIDAVKDRYKIISVADIVPDVEWIEGGDVFAHDKYHNGELNITDLLQLIANSSGVIGAIGWILPAAMAYNIPMLCIFGGWGKYNSPERLFDPRVNCDKIIKALPDNFCKCASATHKCDKQITNFESFINDFDKKLH